MQTESWKAIGQSSMESSIWISSIMESIRITNSKRLRSSNDMNWGSFLLSGKTTGSSIIKSSLEGSFSSGNFLYIIQISTSNLLSLYVIIHRCKSSMFASNSCIKSSLEISFGSSNFRGVFQRSSSSNSKNKYQLKHFDCLTKESSE